MSRGGKCYIETNYAFTREISHITVTSQSQHSHITVTSQSHHSQITVTSQSHHRQITSQALQTSLGTWVESKKSVYVRITNFNNFSTQVLFFLPQALLTFTPTTQVDIFSFNSFQGQKSDGFLSEPHHHLSDKTG